MEKEKTKNNEVLGIMGNGRVRLEKKDGVLYLTFLFTHKGKRQAFWIKYADMEYYFINFKELLKAKGYGTDTDTN